MAKASRYGAGQRWAFDCALAEFEHTLVIGNVFGPPHTDPAVYTAYVRYAPDGGKWTPPGVDGVNLSLTAAALDRSVTKLVADKVKLPSWWHLGQEKDLPDRPQPDATISWHCEEVKEGLLAVLTHEQYREEGRRRAASAVSRKEVLRQLVPWREAHRRHAWKPIVETIDGEPTASKFSGTAWLARGEDWPQCSACQRPMQLFLQLNLSQLPREAKGRHGKGLLQLFYCAYTEMGECPDGGGFEPFQGAKLVRVVHPRGAARRTKIPVADSFPPKTIVDWQALDDYPNGQDHRDLGIDYRYDFSRGTVDVFCDEPKLEFQGQKSSGLVEAISSALPGDKLGGWPRWIQHLSYPNCPQCGQRMELVFQIDSNDNLPYTFGDLGTGHVTQCPEHKQVVTFAWACS